MTPFTYSELASRLKVLGLRVVKSAGGSPRVDMWFNPSTGGFMQIQDRGTPISASAIFKICEQLGISPAELDIDPTLFDFVRVRPKHLDENLADVNENIPGLVIAAGLAKVVAGRASDESPQPDRINEHIQRLEGEIQTLEVQEKAIDQAEIGFFQPFFRGVASILSIWPRLPPPRVFSYLDRDLADDWQRLQEDFLRLAAGGATK